MISGRVRIGSKTKELVKRLKPGEIALIAHRDLDEVAARSLCRIQPKAVLNTKESISGRYPNPGPRLLFESGIYLLDRVEDELFERLHDGDRIVIDDETVYRKGRPLGSGIRLDGERIAEKMAVAEMNLETELDSFVENTLKYARREKGLILGWFELPDIQTALEDKQVLVVVRGQNYLQDLETISAYIQEVRPVLIGVDGGADAIFEAGFRPDIIIGDMDSVSDHALACGSELVVHAYPDGRAPGLKRVQDLELEAKTFAAPGTSEDIALLLAYEKGASLIVAVGTHSNMIDFLEKGRSGMASTFLVRLKVGPVLVDARGVNKLYRKQPSFCELLGIMAAALFPMGIVGLVSVPFRQYLRLLVLRFWILLGL